jgi:sugar lactone lactonase YvrE
VEVLATEADGTKLLVTDGAAVSKDGLVYFTDASVKFPLGAFLLDSLEGRPNGRILVYNPAENSTTVLLKDLYFPNGIALSKDEEFFIFSESTLARLLKYYLRGEKKGTVEVINDKLPGFPDNVHYNQEKGILYVGVVGQRDAIAGLLWKTPILKKLLALFPALLAAADSAAKTARVVAVDENGNPLKMYQDPTGKEVGFVTAGIEADGYLYLSSLRDDFVGRIPV